MDEPQPGDATSKKWCWRSSRRSLIALVATVAAMCLALLVLSRRDDLLGLTLAVVLMDLFILTLMSSQNRAIRALRRKDADRLKDARDRRRWQFSLRSLFVVTTVCAGVCSLLKIVPPLLLLFALYVGVVFLLVFLGVALVISVVNGLTALIERHLFWFVKDSRRKDTDQPDGGK